MADFAAIKEDGIPVWINLDYVVSINRGLDPHEPTQITFSDGKHIAIPRDEGDRLVAQLNQCCKSAAQDGSKKKSNTGSIKAIRRPRR